MNINTFQSECQPFTIQTISESNNNISELQNTIKNESKTINLEQHDLLTQSK